MAPHTGSMPPQSGPIVAPDHVTYCSPSCLADSCVTPWRIRLGTPPDDMLSLYTLPNFSRRICAGYSLTLSPSPPLHPSTPPPAPGSSSSGGRRSLLQSSTNTNDICINVNQATTTCPPPIPRPPPSGITPAGFQIAVGTG